MAFAAALACLALAWPAVVAAAPQSEQELLQRIEELRPRLEKARLQLDSAEHQRVVLAAVEPHEETTLVVVGPLRIVTTPRQAELARTVFQEVWQRDFASVSGSPSLSRYVFTFRWTRAEGNRLYVDPTATGGASVQRVELNRSWVPTWAGVESRLRDALWGVLREDLPVGSPTRDWLGGARYVEPARTYRLLVSAPVGAERACLGGEAGACAAAVGLRREAPAPRSTDAFAGAAKVDLLWYAVARGGDGAWGRAVEASGSRGPADVLTRASGLALDDLTVGWRDALAAGHEKTAYAGLGSTGWRVLLWFLVLATLATRSKRWRLV